MRTSNSLLLFAMLAGTSGAEMRIASLNLEKKYGSKLVAEIRKEPDLRAADTLLLQEIAVFAPAFRLNRQFEEGLAILSRYPLSDKAATGLPHNSLHFHTRIRIVLAATGETPFGPLRIVNTHLDNRLNAGAKRKQLDLVWETADKSPGACIIGDDFNTANFFWISHLLPIPGVQSLNGLLRAERRGTVSARLLEKGRARCIFRA
jgi:endonuclease/exonuclease/phosphatase family metal-dependent hydrolase